MSDVPGDRRLSPYFSLSEFACHEGTEVPAELMGNLQTLVDTLTVVRLAAGCPIAVISGYRTPAWNRRVGGADGSAHLEAKAADVRGSKSITVPELHELVLSLHREGELPDLGGLGLYPGWVHIDVKKAADGHLRRWRGRGVGSEK